LTFLNPYSESRDDSASNDVVSNPKIHGQESQKPVPSQDRGLDENQNMIETNRVDFIISTPHSASSEMLKTSKMISSLIKKKKMSISPKYRCLLNVFMNHLISEDQESNV
jgi:hypothetical protein